MLITSPNNALIKKIMALGDKKRRRQYGEFLVESVKAVAECERAGLKIVSVVCSEELAPKFPQATYVTRQLFEKISTEKNPQGVIAVVKIPQNKLVPPQGDCLLLDKLQDPGNVGGIIRTANAAGFTDVYLVECADPYSPKAIRAGMGGTFYINIHEGDYDGVFGALEDVCIVCADMGGEDIFAFSRKGPVCLCIGNEGGGVSSEVEAHAHYTVKIPMRATCESLNAAVSAGIAMYALKNNRQEDN